MAVADLVFLFAWLVAARIALSPIAAYAVGFGAVSASALGSAAACPRLPRRAIALALLPLGVLGALSLHAPADFTLALVVTAALLLGGGLVGASVGASIEHPGHLLFVALVSATADVLSVFHPSGPSNAIAQSKAALSLLALPWPMLGTSRIEAFLGVGDVVFVALYVASARRHGLSLPRTLVALALAFALTLAVVVAFEATIPALPMLGAGMLVVHPAARKPPAKDRVRGFVVAVALAALAAFMLSR